MFPGKFFNYSLWYEQWLYRVGILSFVKYKFRLL